MGRASAADASDERARIHALRELPVDQWPTRERILREASRFFAARGYVGATTREIAAAVGIRQPSLYNHFASKQEIAEGLLDYDLRAGLAFMAPLVAEGGSAAVRIYRYIRWEIAHCLESPFDLRALYSTGLFDQPEFARWRVLLDGYEGSIRDLVRLAVEDGEFIDIDPEFARMAIDALVMETIRANGLDQAYSADQPERAADFLLRAMLREPHELAAIRARAIAVEAVG